MEKINRTNRVFLFIALALVCCSFLIFLFFRGFSDPSEGRYAEIPREMVKSGQWLEMRIMGYCYYEKPPMAYWMVAPAIALLGTHDWAVRVPLLINIIFIIAVFYVLIRKRWPKPIGLIALTTAVAMSGFIANTFLLTDSFLVLWISLTCVSLYSGFQQDTTAVNRFLFLMVASVSAFLGFLTKGAVAVVLPGGILLLWLLWERRPGSLLTPHLLTAALLFVLLLVPAFWLLEQHNPGFIHQFIFDEHIARFRGTRQTQLHAEPFWFYAQVVPMLILPWTFFAIRAVYQMAVKRGLSNDSLSRFLVVWFFVIVIFFSIGKGKLMSYISAAIPPLGLLVGRWGLAIPKDNTKKDRLLWNLGVAGFLITALAVVLLWIVSFFQILPGTVYQITGISVVALIPMAVTLGVVFSARKSNDFFGLILVSSGILLTIALLLSPLAGKDFNVFLHINSSHVYKQLARILKPEDRVVVFWSYRPALPFYTQRLYFPFQEKNELARGMQIEPEREGYLEDIAGIHQVLKTTAGRVYALVEPQDLETKFKPLGLRYTSVNIPRDPNTIFLELLPPESDK